MLEVNFDLQALVFVLARACGDSCASSPSASAESSRPVSFEAGCWVRAEPSIESEQVGVAEPGVEYAVMENRHGWRRIELPTGTSGGSGCRPSHRERE